MLAAQQLLGDDAGQTAEHVPAAVDHDRLQMAGTGQATAAAGWAALAGRAAATASRSASPHCCQSQPMHTSNDGHVAAGPAATMQAAWGRRAHAGWLRQSQGFGRLLSSTVSDPKLLKGRRQLQPLTMPCYRCLLRSFEPPGAAPAASWRVLLQRLPTEEAGPDVHPASCSASQAAGIAHTSSQRLGAPVVLRPCTPVVSTGRHGLHSAAHAVRVLSVACRLQAGFSFVETLSSSTL